VRTTLIFTAAYCLSVFAAMLAAIELAVYLKTQEEFIAVMMALILFSLLAIAAFAVAYPLSDKAGMLDAVAVALAVIAVALVALPALIEARGAGNPFARAQDRAVAAELLLPGALMLLIQWTLIRRRWRVTHRAGA
jgi:hypothetical protein